MCFVTDFILSHVSVRYIVIIYNMCYADLLRIKRFVTIERLTLLLKLVWFVLKGNEF